MRLSGLVLGWLQDHILVILDLWREPFWGPFWPPLGHPFLIDFQGVTPGVPKSQRRAGGGGDWSGIWSSVTGLHQQVKR